MNPAIPRNEFAPPPPGGMARALTLALLAHLLLVLALAWGLNWRREASHQAIMAELWSAPPPPPPPPAVRIEPTPPPVVRPPPPRPAPEPAVQPRQADLALEQKKKADAERRAAEEAARRVRIEFDRRQAAEQARQKQEAEKKAAAAEQARQKQEAERKEQVRRKEEAARQEAARQEADRIAALNRMRQQAGKDSASAVGNAPSAGYGDKVRAVVYSNLVFIDTIQGSPVAEVEVRTTPDGTITGRRLVKSSGLKAWDEAVLRAIDKTRTMPRDTDGRVPSPMIIEFRP